MTKVDVTTIDKGMSADILKEGLSLDKSGISTWLKEKKILQGDEKVESFKDLTPWSRTGGETYSATFNFSTNKATYSLIAKAIITSNPEKRLIDWTKRRKLLLNNGIPVSNWFWVGEATIIESFYPKTYKEVSNVSELIKIAFLLDKLGFTTLKYLDDIRCDSNGNPFYIDFGFDLGEPSEILKASAKEYFIKRYPEREKEIEILYHPKQPYFNQKMYLCPSKLNNTK